MEKISQFVTKYSGILEKFLFFNGLLCEIEIFIKFVKNLTKNVFEGFLSSFFNFFLQLYILLLISDTFYFFLIFLNFLDFCEKNVKN